MAKSRKRRRERPRQSSRLADHKRQGKLLRPPMLAAMGDAFRAVSWAKQHLPDHLWLCWHLSEGEPAQLVRLCRWLDSVEEALGEDRTDFPQHWILTGQLSAFEGIPVGRRADLLDSLQREDLYDLLVPEDMAHAIGMYPTAPGRWLIQPWLDTALRVDPDVARERLSEVVRVSLDGRDPVATYAKATVFRQYVQAGKMHFPSSMRDELSDVFVRYPLGTTKDESARVESFIRASFGAMLGAADVRGDSDPLPATWSKTFWRSNWRLFPCIRAEQEVGATPTTEDIADASAAIHEVQSDAAALRIRFNRLADTADPDIYDPDRNEVLTGLVARVLRYLDVYVGFPPLWTMEHGAPLLRAVVETRIIVRFLARQTRGTDLLHRFKAYGMGRLKLLKLHFEEYLAATQDPNDDMVAYVEYLSALVNQDVMEEFQEIDLGGNFAGVDMRTLAGRVGLERDYRLLFAPASSNVHGEWSVIDEYALERCRNPLHMGHRIVRHDVDSPVGSMVLGTIFEFIELLIDEYEAATSTDRNLLPTTETASSPEAPETERNASS